MANNERIYVGKARLKNGKFGEFFNIWITPEGVEDITRNTNAQGSINLVMSEMREPDRAGFTHTLYVDDYVPQSRTGGGDAPRQDSGDRDNGGRGQGQQGGGYRQQGGSRNQGGRNDGGFGAPPPQPPPYPPEDDPGFDPDNEIPF